MQDVLEVRSSDISMSSSAGSTGRENSEAAFQTQLGLGSEHGLVRWATIRGAQDLLYYHEGNEVPDENTGTE